MPVTLKDVAARAGVSTSAVSRTFTAGASVSAEMRRKVEQAAEELGYHPNALASSLTTGRTKLIGLVTDNFRNPMLLEVFDLFTRGLQERGLRPLLVNLSGEVDPTASVRMLRQYSVDGVIVASSTLQPSFAKAFRDAGIPVVNSFGRKASAPLVHVVGIDNIECGRMAARTLIARGYRALHYLGGPPSATSAVDRLSGFLDALDGNAGVQPTHGFAGAYTFEAGRREMARLLSADWAEAYFCADDVLSIGALSAIADAGLSTPDDVGVIGLNDMEISGWANIDLTTIRQPVGEIIEASINLVVEMLDAPEQPPKAQIFPCEIVERGTLRPIEGAKT